MGDRVAYAAPPIGAYAETRLMQADRLVVLPDGISDQQAAAMMLKGMTAQYLLRRTFRVEPGQTILFHAAAGGVGLIACQWAKHLGARVIGTVGSEAKAELARAHGCDEPIRYDREDVASRVRELTDGKGVPVVYDSVGQSTFEASLDCLAPLGTLVSFGQSSGTIPPVNLGILSQKGSLYVTRPTLMTYTAAARRPAGIGQGAVRGGGERRREDQRPSDLSPCATPPTPIGRSKAVRPPAPPCCCRDGAGG